MCFSHRIHKPTAYNNVVIYMAEYCRLCAQTEVNEQTIENHIKFNIKQSIDVDCSENYF